MKKIIYIFLLIGFGLNAQSNLLFKSGFEGNVEILPLGGAPGFSGDYRPIVGNDEGFDWDVPLIDSYGIGIIGGIHVVWDQTGHVENELETVIGHNGTPTTALRQLNIASTQMPYQINDINNIPENTYLRFWVKTDDLDELINGTAPKTRMLWQYKTGLWYNPTLIEPKGYRTSIKLVGRNDGSNEIFWAAQGDWYTGKNTYWVESTSKEPDRTMGLNVNGWNLVEILVGWAKDDTGQFVFRLNGVEVFNRQNQRTLGVEDVRLSFLSIWQFYGSGGQQWIDDVEIWSDDPNIPFVNATSVSITETATIPTIGGTSQLIATVLPSTASNKYGKWTSSDEGVATVDEAGLVTGVGSGTATITFTTDDGGYTDTSAITVNPSTGSVTANAGSDVSICDGENITLTASGGSTYLWSTEATTASITVSPSSTQTYTVTVSDGSGNTDTDDVIVTVNSVTANAGADVTINEGDSVTLTANGGGSYLWNTGATTQSITVSPTSSQNYTVTVTSNGCDDTDTVRVNVNATTGSVTANAGSDTAICAGEITTLTASGGSSYTWSTGATTSSINVSPSSTQTYTVTVSDSNGNSDTDDVVVTVNSVTANAGSDVTIDEGDNVTLTGSGGDSYVWNTGATTQSITVSPTSSLDYTVTVTSNGCDDTDTVRVNVNQSTGSVTANAGSDTAICAGESTTLTASGGSSYTWSSGATTASITVSPNTTQTYTVTARDGSGNSDTDDVIVTVNSVTANSGVDKTITLGETVKLTASGGDSYTWNTGATGSSITVSPSTTTNYTVIVTKNGCNDTDSVKVSVTSEITNPPPAEAFAGDDFSICLGESVTLNASGGDSYTWSTGDSNTNIDVNPTRTTTYTLSATRGGTTDMDSITVSVENCNISSLPEEGSFNELSIYPNPTQGILHINMNNTNQDFELIINDTKGSIIYRNSLTSSHMNSFSEEIDLSRYSDGLYFVRLYSAEQYLVKKVMVQ